MSAGQLVRRFEICERRCLKIPGRQSHREDNSSLSTVGIAIGIGIAIDDRNPLLEIPIAIGIPTFHLDTLVKASTA